MISVVCVSNDRTEIEKCLLPSLESQSVKFELIVIDNSSKKFESAARALNYGAEGARGKYIMFVHQDVLISSRTWLENVERILDGIRDVGIAGVAGKASRNIIFTNINHKEGSPPPAGKVEINSPTIVQTVDECLFLIPRRVFSNLQFDEEVCSDWHLYAVDYSLSVGQRELSVYVLPFEGVHMSHGKSSLSTGGYYHTLRKVMRKHRDNYKHIYTTMGVWNTHQPVWLQRMVKRFNTLVNVI